MSNPIINMAKRSQRFPVQYERDQSGCMWGFISMFDFRQARFTRKLIVDKRHNNKHALGNVQMKLMFEFLLPNNDNFILVLCLYWNLCNVCYITRFSLLFFVSIEVVPTKNKFEALSNLDEEYQGNFVSSLVQISMIFLSAKFGV